MIQLRSILEPFSIIVALFQGRFNKRCIPNIKARASQRRYVSQIPRYRFTGMITPITSFIVGAAGIEYLAGALTIISTLQANDPEEYVAPVLVEYIQEAKVRAANFQSASLQDLDELFSASSEPRKYIWERSKEELKKSMAHLSSATDKGGQHAYRLLAVSNRKRMALCHMEMDDAAVNFYIILIRQPERLKQIMHL
jgi:hypothetical protein